MKEPRLKRNLGPTKAKRLPKHRRSPKEELDEFYRNRPVRWDEAKDVPHPPWPQRLTHQA